jgi:hypothetical protein
MTIDRMINNVKSLNFNEVIGNALHKSSDDLVIAQQQQMLRGETAMQGQKIGKYKSKSYRKKKFDMNPLAGYGNVDLKLTGIFQKNIKIYFFSESFFLTSTDSKTAKLVGAYGEEIFGLSPKSRKPIITKKIAPVGRLLIKQHILS